VSKESKVLIGVGGLALIGLLLAASGRMAVGLVMLALGLIGGVAALRVTKPDTSDPFAAVRSEADRSNTGRLTDAEPLAPWVPEGGLNAWTPPVDLEPPAADPYAEHYADSPNAPSTAPEPPAAPDSAGAPAAPEPPPAWDNSAWETSVSWDSEPTAPVETNPLDDLIGLDTLDPIAEVERIDNRSATLAAAPPDTTVDGVELDIYGSPVINENVTGADDIMAASQATELNLADGEQTELQKLLAKVQMRLSAYE